MADRQEVFNIAVTGESGVGKSSFVNAIRGLTDEDEEAATVGEVETTMEPKMYPHPSVPNLNIWDLPGIGTSSFGANSYANKMKFNNYDFFIIVSAGRFKENEKKLAKEIKKTKKGFYFVRSKIDSDVVNAERRGKTEQETLEKIRKNCEENLSEFGSPSVFLISSHDRNRYDFLRLTNTLESDFPENRRKIEIGRELLDCLDNLVLNIAVTGESGAGKSSLVNAIRSLADTDDGAAPVGEIETTMEPTVYSHPTIPKVSIWDLPGVGVEGCNISSYTEKTNFQAYDFFIIVSAARFTENDIKLAKEIKKNKKNFYFVHSKIDIDVECATRRVGAREEKTLQQIRDSCVKNLSDMGPPPVFLISSHDLSRFDFPKLVDFLMKDLPENKRVALVQSLPVYSKKSLLMKYNMFKKSVWALAFASAGIGAAPVPGLSTACDVAMVVSFFTKCYHAFGLDDKSLIKLGKRVDKPILAKVQESELIQALAKNTLGSSDLIMKLVMAGAVETACIFVPVAGNIIAAGVSFATTRSVLLKGLDELHNCAKLVIDMAGLP